MLKEITKNKYNFESDRKIFAEPMVSMFKKCKPSNLLPVSVTFLPNDILMVERLHQLWNYEDHHKEDKTLGKIHTLYYKDGKRVLSLISYDGKYETCSPLSCGDNVFIDYKTAIKEIAKTLNNNQ